ncbi:hypothetical protein HGRIS_006029 [Hohenbuehelia grisea]|uniref:Uncharacterized protein n=1 Tax=Hohenbuehelia grisea TaxID=104357 RepID=A0ABR3JYP9_9AGAR
MRNGKHRMSIIQSALPPFTSLAALTPQVLCECARTRRDISSQEGEQFLIIRDEKRRVMSSAAVSGINGGPGFCRSYIATSVLEWPVCSSPLNQITVRYKGESPIPSFSKDTITTYSTQDAHFMHLRRGPGIRNPCGIRCCPEIRGWPRYRYQCR